MLKAVEDTPQPPEGGAKRNSKKELQYDFRIGVLF